MPFILLALQCMVICFSTWRISTGGLPPLEINVHIACIAVNVTSGVAIIFAISM